MASARRFALPTLLAGVLLASACHKAPEAPANTANAVEPAPEALPSLPEANVAVPASEPKKAVAVPPDNTHISDEDQIREDAEATGMTSRLHADEPKQEPGTGEPNGNTTHP